MSDAHTIRLRGPWQFQPLFRWLRDDAGQVRQVTDDLPPGGKTPVPGDWTDALGKDFLGCVRYTRHFHCPTNIESHERVWLVCEGVDHVAAFSLNGNPLFSSTGAESPAAHDITAHLQPHNVLTVDVSVPPDGLAATPVRPPARQDKGGGLIGEVRLEIRR
jgi:beta-galactosidase/beta-glucuronidase